MNIALIFAGGFGNRMCTKSRPKQFLEYNGKPIIIYTLELFDNHPDIDGIVVVCLENWIPFLQKMLKKFEIDKVVKIVKGGSTGQESIYNGLIATEEISGNQNDTIVLIHDGVRPLITEETITDNIRTVREKGNCITSVPATESFIVKHDDGSIEIPVSVTSIGSDAFPKAAETLYVQCNSYAQQWAKENKYNSKATYDNGWGTFRNMLKYLYLYAANLELDDQPFCKPCKR